MKYSNLLSFAAFIFTMAVVTSVKAEESKSSTKGKLELMQIKQNMVDACNTRVCGDKEGDELTVVCQNLGCGDPCKGPCVVKKLK